MFNTFYRWAILTTLGVIASDKDDDKGTEDDEDGAEGPFLYSYFPSLYTRDPDVRPLTNREGERAYTFCGYREMFAPAISSLVMNGVRYLGPMLRCLLAQLCYK